MMKRYLAYMFILAAVLSAVRVDAQDRDWAKVRYYEQQNQELMGQPVPENRVVFMGNSITEDWARIHPDFFAENGYVGRGISGQTSYQFVVRFRTDVINLKPKAVVINAGTNDIAENSGPYNEDYTFGNIVSMVELAEVNGIEVILSSVLPAASFGWRESVTGAPEKIKALNARIKAYAESKRIPYVDYYSRLLADDGESLNPNYTKDGVHPMAAGYDVMERLVKQTIDEVLK